MGTKKALVKSLGEFRQRLSAEMPISKMIFFGSRASGKPHRDSDVDLLIVSPAFRRKRFRYRPLGLYTFWTLRYPVDFLCYTPEEFRKMKKQAVIVREAVENGIEIN